GEPLGDALEIVPELGRGIGRPLDARRLLVGEIGEDVAPQVGEALVGEAEAAGGEERIAAALVLRPLLEGEEGGAARARGQRGAQRGIATADDDDVGIHGLKRSRAGQREWRSQGRCGTSRSPPTYGSARTGSASGQ